MIDSLFRLIVFGAPAVAGLTLVIILLVKEMRPAIGGGFVGALVFALIGFWSFGKDLRSDSGWGWVALGAALLIGLYLCAGFIFGVGFAAAVSRRYRRISPLPLLFGLLVPFAMPLHSKVVRANGQRRWAEMQEFQRRNPHALVNDVALPDEEDSGYRVRFVDDQGVVRATNEFISVTPYVVLPPGKHRLVLHADTPKGDRLKLEWSLQDVVEVEAGHLYKLQVAKGKIKLAEVSRFRAPDQQPSEPTTPSRRGSP